MWREELLFYYDEEKKGPVNPYDGKVYVRQHVMSNKVSGFFSLLRCRGGGRRRSRCSNNKENSYQGGTAPIQNGCKRKATHMQFCTERGTPSSMLVITCHMEIV